MAWPTATDYNEAVQDLRQNVADEELRAGRPALTPLKLPMIWSGGFADVYKIHAKDGNAWALKCFTRKVAGQAGRYKRISKHLHRARLPFMVDFKYLDQGIRVHGEWYPALKMRWVEGGIPLNQFVEQYLDRPRTLKQFLQLWVKMADRLREAKMAHADLQHGNVLLVPQANRGLALKLIDYDGMYVPAFAGTRSAELGHPAFQHPQRSREKIYSAEVDRFSNLAIYSAIHCLTVGREKIWKRFNNDDNLLFREDDFSSPADSDVFQTLWNLPDAGCRSLTGRLILACTKPLDQSPLLNEVANGQVFPLTLAEEQAVESILSSKTQTLPAAVVEPAETPLAEPVPTDKPLPDWMSPSRSPETPAPQRSRIWLSLLAMPLRLIDRLLAKMVGEENVILHNFVRIMALVVLASVIVVGAKTANKLAADKAAADKAAAEMAAVEKAAVEKAAAEEMAEKEAAEKAAAEKAVAEEMAEKAAAEKAVAEEVAQKEVAEKVAAAMAAAEKTAAADMATASTQKTPFDDILSRNCHLPLPPQDFRPGKSAETVELAKLFVDPEVECSLSIIGNREVHGDEKKKFFTEPKDSSPKQRSWEVLYGSGGALKKRSPVGTFTLADQALSFRWYGKTTPTAQAGKLQYCLLKIEVDEGSQTCILSTPSVVEPLTLYLDSDNPLIEIPLVSKDIPDKRYLRLDLQLQGFPEHKLFNAFGKTVTVGDPIEENICDIKIPGGDGDDRMDDFLTIRLGFMYNKRPISVRYGLQREEYLKLLVYYPRPRDKNAEQRAPLDEFVEITAEIAKKALKECGESKVDKYSRGRTLLLAKTRERERDLKSLQDKIKVAQKQRSDIQKEINQAVPPGANDAAAAMTRELQKLELNVLKDSIPLENDRKELKDLDYNISFRETNRQRLEKRAEFVKTIKNEGRIHFRVYAMIEGQEVDIMRSSGFTKETPK